MGIESKSQEKYPPISNKKEPAMGMEEWKTKKYPQPSQNAIKKSLSWVWRAEDREKCPRR